MFEEEKQEFDDAAERFLELIIEVLKEKGLSDEEIDQRIRRANRIMEAKVLGRN